MFDIDDNPFGNTSLSTLLGQTSPGCDIGEAAAEVPLELEPGEIFDTPLGGATLNFLSSSQTRLSTSSTATKNLSGGEAATGSGRGDLIKTETSVSDVNRGPAAFVGKPVKSDLSSSSLDKKSKLETMSSHKDKGNRQRSLFSPVQDDEGSVHFPTVPTGNLLTVKAIEDKFHSEKEQVKTDSYVKKEEPFPNRSASAPTLISLPVSIPLGSKSSSLASEGCSEHKEKKKKKKDKKDKEKGEKKHKNKHKDKHRDKHSKLNLEPMSSEGSSTPTSVTGIKLKIKTPGISGGTSSGLSPSTYVPPITISFGSEGSTKAGDKKRPKSIGSNEGPVPKRSRALGTDYDMDSSELQD